jgi:hypothetical protein
VTRSVHALCGIEFIPKETAAGGPGVTRQSPGPRAGLPAVPHRQDPGPVSGHPPPKIEGRLVSASTMMTGPADQACPGCGETTGVRIVDARTSMEYLITDESVVAHRQAGRYLAVCGAQVLAASLTAPQRSRCPACTRGVR